MQLDREIDSWKLDQIREFWPISLQDRAQTTSLVEKGTARAAADCKWERIAIPGLLLLWRQTVFSVQTTVLLSKVKYAWQRKKHWCKSNSCLKLYSVQVVSLRPVRDFKLHENTGNLLTSCTHKCIILYIYRSRKCFTIQLRAALI